MAIEINEQLLRTWPLPLLSEQGDKEERGHVLVIAGSPEIPGAAVLASVAALRAGAGKLTVATHAAVFLQVAQALPEARVIPMPDKLVNDAGEATWLPKGIDAILIGPGMLESGISALVATVLHAYPGKSVVLDAVAIEAVNHIEGAVNILLTPHAGEMASLLSCDKSYVSANAQRVAREAAHQLGVGVLLKGAETHLAQPNGDVWIHRGGDLGLATSGSGDVLAGLITGFLAQGATLSQGAAWGIVCHALAGALAAQALGARTGYLAREISIHVPKIVADLSGGDKHAAR